jgi:tetratricopeptide (TPR) repeat protein
MAQQAVRLNPGLAEAHVSLGAIYAGIKRSAEAIQEESRALELDPASADAYVVLGDAYENAGQHDMAEAKYREAVRRQPADWTKQFALGFFYLKRSRNAEARAAFEAADQLTPHNAMVDRHWAILEMQEGKFREASDLIANEEMPNARDYITVGATYYYQRRYQEAADAFNLGLKLDPGIYQLWGNLGSIYQHLPGREQDARQVFRKAIELAQNMLETVTSDDITHANLALYWAELGNREKALQEVNRIPAAARAEVADRLIVAYERTGNRRLAVEIIKSLPAGNSQWPYIRHDPEMEALWRDPALRGRH